MLPLGCALRRAAVICCGLLIVACGDSSHRSEEADGAVSAFDPATGRTGSDAGLPPGMQKPPPVDLGGAGPLDAGANTGGQGIDAGSTPSGTLPIVDAAVCPVDASPESCACAANPSTCQHPLRGRYAVRTVSYARQKTTAAGQAVDVVSKGVLLSVADISAAGVVKEHLCFVELLNQDGLFSWIEPSGAQHIPDSTAQLEEHDGSFVRPSAADKTNVSWSSSKQPASCAAGTTDSSGCLCFAADTLPSDPKDCRVTDLDQDGLPGLKLSVSLERPLDPATASAPVTMQIAGVKAVEWRLPEQSGEQLLGKVDGSIEQNQLSVAGDLVGQLEKVKSANCGSDTGHVELVRGDFDCAMLLAGRPTHVDDYGIFDAKLDAVPPLPTACPDPDCAGDTDHDGTPDCKDLCPMDPAKIAVGSCGCGVVETNTDGDAQPDCLDGCVSDPAKIAAGSCGCGMLETDSDADGTPDCVDGCVADPAKKAPGGCGCGAAETNTDGDAQPDCVDGCVSDPAKTAPGTCGCGALDTDSDADATPDCHDACISDPAKIAAGQCGCGVADKDLNGDGTIDCVDLCPSDPAKLAPGACGCGVADTNTDGDAQPDCTDACPSDPAKVAAGKCGCGVAESVCNNPLLGTYAARIVLHARQRIGTGAATTSRAIGYSLVTITNGAAGALTVSEQTCWAQSLPNPSEGGIAAYSWSKPAWMEATPPAVRTAPASTSGSWVASAPDAPAAWDPARQPAACVPNAVPAAGWPAAWGANCACHATALPPYNRGSTSYDCRLTDPDADGYPGLSAYVATTAPSTPEQDAPSGLFGGRVFAAGNGASRWTLTAGANGKHTGTVNDDSTSVVVGCIGGACAGLSDVAPTVKVCPEALNTIQLVPTTASYDSCGEIVAQRGTLFDSTRDASWAAAAACPAP